MHTIKRLSKIILNILFFAQLARETFVHALAMVGHAQRSFYTALLDAGVIIYLYKTPILLHSKFMTIDDTAATVGSSNMDLRSFLLNLEVTVTIYDKGVVRKLQAIEQTYIARSVRVSRSAWAKRSRLKRFIDNLARLTSSLQ